MDNFVVSARKYRPADFNSVVGQNHITSTLKNAIERGQLAHAYLFCGPRGVGKTTCARIFAKAINCMDTSNAEACNACESCESFNGGRSINIHELDAASNNSVEDIRTLIEQVRIIPQVGKYSLFIIDEVHMLSTAAFNAFLKTLEEPPAHAIFILATTEKHKIIPTILSRCQIYDFNRIRVEDSVKYLRHIAQQEKIGADDESLNLIAQKADGGMRDALSMFDKAVSFCGNDLNFKEVAKTLNILDYDTYFAITEVLWAGNYIDALLIFDQILSNGFSGQTFMSGLNQHVRDLLVAKNPKTLPLIEMTGTLLEKYKQQAVKCDIDFLFGIITILTEIDGKIRQSSNQRLLIELGLMKIAGLGQKKNNNLVVSEYNLPELVSKKIQPTDSTTSETQKPIETQTPKVVKEMPQSPSATQEPTSTETKALTGTKTTIETTLAEHNPPSSDTKPQTSTVPKASKTSPSPRKLTTLISGSSLSDMLNQSSKESVEDEQEQDTSHNINAIIVDADCQNKIEGKRAEILKHMGEKRPRFVAAFEFMTVSENVINISVPTTELEDEILRNKTEILMDIVEIAAVNGLIRLNIKIAEQEHDVRPIKLEDKIKYMIDKNPQLMKLKEVLDLEVE